MRTHPMTTLFSVVLINLIGAAQPGIAGEAVAGSALADDGQPSVVANPSHAWTHTIRATGLHWTRNGNREDEEPRKKLYMLGRDKGNRLAQAGFNTAILWGFHRRLREDPPTVPSPSLDSPGEAGAVTPVKTSLREIVQGLQEFTAGLHDAGIFVVEHHGAITVLSANPTIGGIPIAALCQVDAFGTPGECSLTRHGFYKLCPNKADVGEVYRRHIEDILEYTDVDALMSDDVLFQHVDRDNQPRHLCHCDVCQARFFTEKEYDISDQLHEYHSDFWGNYDRPMFRAWIRARMGWVGDWCVWLREDVMNQVPGGAGRPLWSCLSAFSSGFPRNSGIAGEELARGEDVIFYEGMTGRGSVNAGYFHQWTRDIAEIEIARAIARPDDKPILVLRYTREGEERAFSWMLDRAFGVRSWHQGDDYTTDLSYDDEFAKLVRWEEEHEDYFPSPSHRPASVGVLFSPQTRTNRLRGTWTQAEYRGWVEALLLRNRPFRVVEDTDLTTPGALAGLTTLILPEVTCLSGAQRQALASLARDPTVKVYAIGPHFGRYDEYGRVLTGGEWTKYMCNYYITDNPGASALPRIAKSPWVGSFLWEFTEDMAAAADRLDSIIAGLEPDPLFAVISCPRGFIVTLVGDSRASMGIPRAGDIPYAIHLINATGTAWAQCTDPPCQYFLPEHDASFPLCGSGFAVPPIELTIQDGPFVATLHSPDLDEPLPLGTFAPGEALLVDCALVERYALVTLMRVDGEIEP